MENECTSHKPILADHSYSSELVSQSAEFISQNTTHSSLFNAVSIQTRNLIELMLTRRATASVQFRTQVVLVYLQYISAKIHSKCASQPKLAKKSLKTHIFGVQGRSRSSTLVPPESSPAVLVMICSKSVYLQQFSC